MQPDRGTQSCTRCECTERPGKGRLGPQGSPDGPSRARAGRTRCQLPCGHSQVCLLRGSSKHEEGFLWIPCPANSALIQFSFLGRSAELEDWSLWWIGCPYTLKLWLWFLKDNLKVELPAGSCYMACACKAQGQERPRLRPPKST